MQLPKPMQNAQRQFRLLTVFAVAVCLSACQPSADERFARAQDYFQASDYRSTVLELKNALQSTPDFPEARFLLGQASFLLGDFPTAQVEFERALSQGLTDDAVWLELGQVLLAQQRPEETLERVLPDLDANSTALEVQLLFAETYLRLGNFDAAQTHYELAMQIDAKTPEVYVGRAMIAELSGDSATAESLLEQGIDVQPQSDVLWRARANYLSSKGLYSDAAEAFKNSIQFETPTTLFMDRLTSRVYYVSALIEAKDFEPAEQRLTELERNFAGVPITDFLRGRLAFAVGDKATAETALRQYIAQEPNDLRGLALLGAVSYSQSHLNQAETFLSQAVRNQIGGGAAARLLAETRLRLDKPQEALAALQNDVPIESDPGVMALYGRAQLGLGNTETAVEIFEKGAREAGNDPDVLLSIAAGFFAAGESARAIEVLDRIASEDDGQYRKETLLLAAFLREGDTQSAIDIVNTLLVSKPNDPAAHALAGALFLSLSDNESARSALERGRQLEPNHPSSTLTLSRLESLAGQTETAENLLLTLLDERPKNIQALSSLFAIYESEQRTADLLPRLTAAVDLDPYSLALRLLLIQVLQQIGDLDGALLAVTDAKKLFPDEPRILHAEGKVNAELGNLEAGLTSLRAAANAERGNPDFQFDLASLNFALGDLDASSIAIRRFRELRPSSLSGLKLDLSILARRGDFDRARTTISAFERTYPTVGDLTVLKGDVEMDAGDAVAAAGFFERAAEAGMSRDLVFRLGRAYATAAPERGVEILRTWISDNTNDDEARRMLGQLMEASGRTDDAVDEYERILAANPDDPVVLNNLAWHYAQLGRESAAGLAARAHNLAPDNGSIADTYGWILFGQGEYDQAVVLLEKAVVLSPDNPEIQYHLAAAHAKLGNLAEAQRVVDDLLATYPSFSSRAAAEQLSSTL